MGRPSFLSALENARACCEGRQAQCGPVLDRVYQAHQVPSELEAQTKLGDEFSRHLNMIQRLIFKKWGDAYHVYTLISRSACFQDCQLLHLTLHFHFLLQRWTICTVQQTFRQSCASKLTASSMKTGQTLVDKKDAAYFGEKLSLDDLHFFHIFILIEELFLT